MIVVKDVDYGGFKADFPVNDNLYKKIKSDVIDECIVLARAEIDFESQAEQKRFVEFMEQLKEKNK